MDQRFENHMAVSSGSVHDVQAPPIPWHSLGPELCGLLLQQDKAITEFTLTFVHGCGSGF